MLRTLILGLSFIAAAPAAAADAAETAPAPASDASAGGAAVKHAKQGAKPRAGHAASVADKADPAAAPPGGDVKMSGMSILGNEDSPKSLVLVPWKSSQLGDMPSVSICQFT